MLAHTLLQWLTELRAEAANVKVGIIPKHFAPSSKSQIKLETLSSVNLIWSVCVYHLASDSTESSRQETR